MQSTSVLRGNLENSSYQQNFDSQEPQIHHHFLQQTQEQQDQFVDSGHAQSHMTVTPRAYVLDYNQHATEAPAHDASYTGEPQLSRDTNSILNHLDANHHHHHQHSSCDTSLDLHLLMGPNNNSDQLHNSTYEDLTTQQDDFQVTRPSSLVYETSDFHPIDQHPSVQYQSLATPEHSSSRSKSALKSVEQREQTGVNNNNELATYQHTLDNNTTSYGRLESTLNNHNQQIASQHLTHLRDLSTTNISFQSYQEPESMNQEQRCSRAAESLVTSRMQLIDPHASSIISGPLYPQSCGFQDQSLATDYTSRISIIPQHQQHPNQPDVACVDHDEVIDRIHYPIADQQTSHYFFHNQQPADELEESPADQPELHFTTLTSVDPSSKSHEIQVQPSAIITTNQNQFMVTHHSGYDELINYHFLTNKESPTQPTPNDDEQQQMIMANSLCNNNSNNNNLEQDHLHQHQLLVPMYHQSLDGQSVNCLPTNFQQLTDSYPNNANLMNQIIMANQQQNLLAPNPLDPENQEHSVHQKSELSENMGSLNATSSLLDCGSGCGDHTLTTLETTQMNPSLQHNIITQLDAHHPPVGVCDPTSSSSTNIAIHHHQDQYQEPQPDVGVRPGVSVQQQTNVSFRISQESLGCHSQESQSSVVSSNLTQNSLAEDCDYQDDQQDEELDDDLEDEMCDEEEEEEEEDDEDGADSSGLTRDERRVRHENIPITYHEIVNMSIDQFNEQLSKYQFTDKQINLIKDIRRRGKNKVAAQSCRKRKMEQIYELQNEVDRLSRQRINLSFECSRLAKEHGNLVQEYDKIKKILLTHNNNNNNHNHHNIDIDDHDENIKLMSFNHHNNDNFHLNNMNNHHNRETSHLVDHPPNNNITANRLMDTCSINN